MPFDVSPSEIDREGNLKTLLNIIYNCFCIFFLKIKYIIDNLGNPNHVGGSFKVLIQHFFLPEVGQNRDPTPQAERHRCPFGYTPVKTE